MFSLRTLLLVVAVAALGSAALVYRTPYWASAVVTLTLCIFAFGLLGIHSNPERRVFWLSASIIGWLYLSLAFVPALSMRDKLLTSWLIYKPFSPKVEADVQHLFDTTDFPPEARHWGRAFIRDLDDIDAVSVGLKRLRSEFNCVYDVVHSLIALALAFGGGAIYSWSVTRKKAKS